MKKILFFLVLITSTTANLFSQSTTLTLPTTDNTSSFNITNGSATIMKLNGDAGFYIGGTDDTGTIPINGDGTRLMWYPAKSAFRVGRGNAGSWNDENIGIYSMGLGYNTKASGGYGVALGSSTTANGDFATAMGVWTTASGRASTAIGWYAVASGTNSIAIGSDISTAGFQGAMILGDYTNGTPTANSSAANQMTMRFRGGYRLFSDAGCTVGMSIAAGGNSWSSISDSTKKENILKADGEYFLNSLSKLKLGSWNYKLQDAKQFRHYGPMAQEIFHYFGKDEFGTIGNDTTLASADMDGIMMICLQALEKRTEELKTELAVNEDKWKLVNEELRKENKELKTEIAGLIAVKDANELLQKKVAEMETSFNEMKTIVAGITKGNPENLVTINRE